MLTQTPSHSRTVLRLYKDILRTHKQRLPFDLRKLGDDYVRNEWKLHTKAKGNILNQFLAKWNEYLHLIKQQHSNFGRDLSTDQKAKLSQNQQHQLETLKHEATKLTE